MHMRLGVHLFSAVAGAGHGDVLEYLRASKLKCSFFEQTTDKRLVQMMQLASMKNLQLS